MSGMTPERMREKYLTRQRDGYSEQVRHLRNLIASAPHATMCATNDYTATYNTECTCWKREAETRAIPEEGHHV